MVVTAKIQYGYITVHLMKMDRSFWINRNVFLLNKNADLQDWIYYNTSNAMGYGICHVLLNYRTCFQSTIWMSGTLYVKILHNFICAVT